MGLDDIENSKEKPEAIDTDSEFSSKDPLRAGLYLVATPIGNLRDITLRALDVLQAADVVLCEDTRVTRKLLSAYQIKARLVSCNDHSEEMRIDEVGALISGGAAVALVSDAGMPLISDPGYKLVRAMASCGYYITSLPGANAPLSALQLSAMPSDSFCFIGFLPNKTKARKDFLARWADVPSCLIAFESARRLQDCLLDIEYVFGARQVAVVREITKIYEEVRRGSAQDLLSYYNQHGAPKGEVVMVIEPPVQAEISDEAIENLLKDALEHMRTKDACAFVAEKTGRKKSALYDMALRMERD